MKVLRVVHTRCTRYEILYVQEHQQQHHQWRSWRRNVKTVVQHLCSWTNIWSVVSLFVADVTTHSSHGRWRGISTSPFSSPPVVTHWMHQWRSNAELSHRPSSSGAPDDGKTCYTSPTGRMGSWGGDTGGWRTRRTVGTLVLDGWPFVGTNKRGCWFV